MSLRRILGYVLLSAMLATPLVYSAPQGGPHKKGKRKGGGGGKKGGGRAPTRKKGGGA